MHQAITQTDKKLTPLNLSETSLNPEAKITPMQDLVGQWKAKPLHGRYRSRIDDNAIDTKASQGWLQSGNLFLETEGFIASIQDQKLQRWIEKPLHGRHANEISQENVDKKASNYWLTSGQMFPETEGFLVAIQDQVIPTNNYKRFILKNLQQSDKCRYGCQDSETHVTGGCQAFAPTDYKERHDIAAKIIHQELAYKLKLTECKLQYYKYTPQCVLENDKYKLYWDRTVLTDQYIKQNRPDIIIVDKGAQKVTLIDVAIPNSNNLTYKNNEKVAKYRELEFQIKRQWKMKYVETIPIIMSSTGVIPRSLLENIKALELSENIHKIIQKGVLLATARIVRKFMGNAST
ncbi:unnamed protein product [Acanthoscelides obtectus]|uniref:Uncharacterized protein n=1 Tax=Acanthoscelides obtectus TaxID=200917 RepID=A0A9P0QEW5_ACAOB|nr:unnamed protein product [Acanthoscelides obtectus]CAK1687893.1 hypothetical protein AOBTE_LOCUS36439 [Acanthoscelides obtectus]